MYAVEIERECIDELHGLVVLKNLVFVQPSVRIGILSKPRLEVLLTLKLAIQHLIRERPVLLCNLVKQHKLRETVSTIIKAPAVHAGNQSAVWMLALIKIRREFAGYSDELWRGVDQIVGKSSCRIDFRISIVFKPACIVMRDDVNHQIERIQSLEPVIAKCIRKLQAQCIVFIHHDR